MRRWCVGFMAMLAILAGLAAIAGRVQWGDWGWHFHWTSDYQLQVGLARLRQGDARHTEEIIRKLNTNGSLEHAALLHGEWLYVQARPLVESHQLGKASPLLVRAVAELNKVLDGSPLHLRAVTLQGLCFIHLGQPDDVAQTLGYVVAHEPDNVDAHRGLAVLYEDQGAHFMALVHLKRVAELDPLDGRPHRLMGLIHKDYDQLPEAVSAYREALKRKLHVQNSHSIRKEMAECLVKQKAFAEALELLEQIQSVADAAAGVAAMRAECLVSLGRTGEATTVLGVALAEQPRAVGLLVQRAKVHLSAGEAEQAVAMLLQAIAVDAHDYDSRYHLMLAYQALGRTADANAQMAAAEQIKKLLIEFAELHRKAGDNPWDRDVRQRLAEVCTSLEKPHDAALWRQAAEACPKPSAAEDPAAKRAR